MPKKLNIENIKKIENLIKNRKMTASEISEETGIPYSSVWHYLTKYIKPKSEKIHGHKKVHVAYWWL